MSAHINFKRLPRPWIAAVAVVIFVSFTVLLFNGGHEKLGDLRSTSWSLASAGTPSQSSLQSLFRKLHQPSIPANAIQYKSYGGQEWNVEGDALWTKRLGEKLCIIDLDNRDFDEKGEIFQSDPLNWDNAIGLSLGVLNHYMYASAHGYKYYYIRTENPPDRRASWKKPPVISKILKDHDVCIYLDSDAIFYRLDLPFEFLLNYWRIMPGETSMAMALDPNSDNNKDRFGRVYLNTGFIIAQNIPRTYDILDAWQGCPDAEIGSKYENCSDFKKAAPGKGTDQAAMGTYIRYDFDGKEDIRELPCTEANGFPQSHSGCYGDFIRHVWTGKDTYLRGAIGESLAGALLEGGHTDFLDTKADFFVEEKSLFEGGAPTPDKSNPEKPYNRNGARHDESPALVDETAITPAEGS